MATEKSGSGAKKESCFTVTRLMWAALIAGVVMSFALIVCIGTTNWVTIRFPNGVFHKATSAYTLLQYSGLWRVCRVELHNNTVPVVERTYCRMIMFFPSQEIIDEHDDIDEGILDYSRSATAFALIGLLLSGIANFFTWYAIHHVRYMYKRVAASLHIITAACILVCVEVFKNSLDYARNELPACYPGDMVSKFGFSFVLTWIVFGVYVAIGVVVFVLSRKRKGERARSPDEALENEPVVIGRV